MSLCWQNVKVRIATETNNKTDFESNVNKNRIDCSWANNDSSFRSFYYYYKWKKYNKQLVLIE